MELTQPPNQWVSWSFTGSKARLERDAAHSPLYSAEGKNE